jgi:predicted DNA-binding protein with PD1-like motif
MKSKVISDQAGPRTTVVVLDTGEEAFAKLTEFANAAGISGASLTAIGAFENAVVGWFDIATKSYRKIRVDEQCEVLSALGDIATGDDGKASLHVHVVLGLADGTTRGGHLLEGKVRPTLEVVLEEAAAGLRRRKRPDLGIALIELADEAKA